MATGRGMVSPRRHGLAFTLIELAAVMTILVILSGVAVISLSNLQGTSESLAAAQIQQDLNYVRQRAMTTGIRTWIQFNVGADKWSVLEEDPVTPGMAGATVVQDPARSSSFVVLLAEDFPGVVLQSATFDGAVSIGFDWLGQPWSYNGSEAVLATDGTVAFANGYQVKVTTGTGYITLVVP